MTASRAAARGRKTSTSLGMNPRPFAFQQVDEQDSMLALELFGNSTGPLDIRQAFPNAGTFLADSLLSVEN